MKAPEDCLDLAEIRTEIDRTDRQIITALGQRFAYVKAAAKFKTNPSRVRAPERLEAMLQQRRAWAEAEGLNPAVIEDVYRALVDYFIDEELSDWYSNKA